MLDLISIGTVSIDLYFTGESLTHDKDRFEFAIGGKYFAEKFFENLGGGATNVAIGTTREGLKTALLAKIGNNPFKKLIVQKLKEVGVTYEHFCQYDDNYMNISSIFVTKQGEKSLVNYRSPHQHLFAGEEEFAALKQARAIYLANLPSVSLTDRIQILRYAKKHNIITFANIGVVDCRRSVEQIKHFLKHVDVLIINGHEFADMVKVPYKEINFHQNIVMKYIPYFLDQTLVITDGEKGSYAYHTAISYRYGIEKPTKMIDSTGAGDGYTAGFIAEYLTSKDIERAMAAGAQYSAKILAKMGAN